MRVGAFLYDGVVECDLRVVLRPIRCGTGDADDPPDVRDDAARDTDVAEDGSTTMRGVFSAGSGGFATLADAVAHVEAMPGFGSTVRWSDVPSAPDASASFAQAQPRSG